MSKILKGSAFTYGTKTDGSAITISINGGSGISMFPTEIRCSYEGDTNTASNSNGETISHCSYNQRKVLNLTGIISGSDVSAADSNFSTSFLVGQSLDVDLTEWAEVDDTASQYIITSAEKTRSSGNYAEWSISAIEYENVTN
jgi:archaellin